MVTRLRRWLLTPMTVCTGWTGPHPETVLRYGNPFVPKSHGMCPACVEGWTAQATRELTVWQAFCQDPRRI